MLGKKTVFVVGAGGSCELGLPTGDALKSQIQDLLVVNNGNTQRFNDDHVWKAVVDLSVEVNGRWAGVHDEYIDAARSIVNALPYALSIDNFLDAHRDSPAIVAMGKIGIARAILSAENKSALGIGRPRSGRLQDIGKLPDNLLASWFMNLMRLLSAGKVKAEFANLFDDVAFIVFNYDRCLELFLLRALTAYYQVSESEARRALAGLNIIHPYGQVGFLPWQSDTPQANFGEPSQGELLAISRSILTFTETVATGVAEAVKSLVGSAETLVFMGFGFLPQNMELLTVNETAKAKRVFLTSYGISDGDVPIVLSHISKMLKKSRKDEVDLMRPAPYFREFVERGVCADLMKNNWLRLTQSGN